MAKVPPLSNRPKPGHKWSWRKRYFEEGEIVDCNTGITEYNPVKVKVVGFRVNRFGRVNYLVKFPNKKTQEAMLEDLVPEHADTGRDEIYQGKDRRGSKS